MDYRRYHQGKCIQLIQEEQFAATYRTLYHVTSNIQWSDKYRHFIIHNVHPDRAKRAQDLGGIAQIAIEELRDLQNNKARVADLTRIEMGEGDSVELADAAESADIEHAEASDDEMSGEEEEEEAEASDDEMSGEEEEEEAEEEEEEAEASDDEMSGEEEEEELAAFAITAGGEVEQVNAVLRYVAWKRLFKVEYALEYDDEWTPQSSLDSPAACFKHTPNVVFYAAEAAAAAAHAAAPSDSDSSSDDEENYGVSRIVDAYHGPAVEVTWVEHHEWTSWLPLQNLISPREAYDVEEGVELPAAWVALAA